jgi:hypothetical protein
MRAYFAALWLLGCGSGLEHPCTWDTHEPAFRDRDATIPTEPGVSLACAGTPIEISELGAFYGGSIGAMSPDDPGDLSVLIRGDRVMSELHFAGDLPDGTYELVASLNPPPSPPPVWPSGGLAGGTFTFTRSRDVPFIDIDDPEERVYEASIDIEFDLVLTDLSNAPAGMPELGCVLTTGPQRAHLVQRGPVDYCTGSLGGH